MFSISSEQIPAAHCARNTDVASNQQMLYIEVSCSIRRGSGSHQCARLCSISKHLCTTGALLSSSARRHLMSYRQQDKHSQRTLLHSACIVCLFGVATLDSVVTGTAKDIVPVGWVLDSEPRSFASELPRRVVRCYFMKVRCKKGRRRVGVKRPSRCTAGARCAVVSAVLPWAS